MEQFKPNNSFQHLNPKLKVRTIVTENLIVFEFQVFKKPKWYKFPRKPRWETVRHIFPRLKKQSSTVMVMQIFKYRFSIEITETEKDD